MTNITLPDGWEYKTALFNEFYKPKYGVAVFNKELKLRQAVLTSTANKEKAIKQAMPFLIEWIESQK